jgi:hypothetical protein
MCGEPPSRWLLLVPARAVSRKRHLAAKPPCCYPKQASTSRHWAGSTSTARRESSHLLNVLVHYKRPAMRTLALLVVSIAALAPQGTAAAKGGIKVLNSIPDAYWGTWAPGEESCKDGDTAAIVLSAKAYSGPLGKCDVASVSETPSPRGSAYSARLRCADPKQTQKQTPANLIIRPGASNQISAGSTFESLRAYQRCSESTPASKK